MMASKGHFLVLAAVDHGGMSIEFGILSMIGLPNVTINSIC